VRADPCRRPDRCLRSCITRWPRPSCDRPRTRSEKLAGHRSIRSRQSCRQRWFVSVHPAVSPRRQSSHPAVRAQSLCAPHGHGRRPGQARRPGEDPTPLPKPWPQTESARVPRHCHPTPAGSVLPDQSATTHAPCRTRRPPALRGVPVPATHRSAGPAQPRARQKDRGALRQGHARPWRRHAPGFPGRGRFLTHPRARSTRFPARAGLRPNQARPLDPDRRRSGSCVPWGAARA
jgi:hypothetical protein